MDLRENATLKEDYTFMVTNTKGNIEEKEHGLYSYDTRFLSRYQLHWSNNYLTLVNHLPRPDYLIFHQSLIKGPSQIIEVKREISLLTNGFTDTIKVKNTHSIPHTEILTIIVDGDFLSIFEIRNLIQPVQKKIKKTIIKNNIHFTYQGNDNQIYEITLEFSHRIEPFNKNDIIFTSFDINLKPGEEWELKIKATIQSPEIRDKKVISYDKWRKTFPEKFFTSPETTEKIIMKQAIDDLRSLLLFTEHGLFPAAGIPWFVAAFGRDALLTAYMLLPYHPEIAEGVLRFLAHYQAKEHDGFREMTPGKIMHEMRYGELTRNGIIPHNPYFGTLDATPLYLVLLHQLWKIYNCDDFLIDIKPCWEKALEWIIQYGDRDNDGFLEYQCAEDGKGLVVQSWKDSNDSMSHNNGELATGLIAPCEVQGYAYAAFRAAEDFYNALGEKDRAKDWQQRAGQLKTQFHSTFWLQDLNIYAMALDGNKKPLKVLNSNAGHLLWSGIVPEDIAPSLVKTLFSYQLWSGWGIRTLGSNEIRYNPVSYHNGSVWPHDTALIAKGLAGYGFVKEANIIRQALFDLAASQPDKRLPELVGGYNRFDGPPVPYPVACRPQAWDVAALFFLYNLKNN